MNNFFRSFRVKVSPASRQLVLVITLAALNVPLIYHYLGVLAAFVYLLAYAVLLIWACKFHPGDRFQNLVLAAMIFLSLALQIVLLIWVAPQFDHQMDRDDALTYWIEALARGEYPYSVPTSRGNPISILPTLPLIALPFYLLGNVGYLEIFSYLFLIGLLWMAYKQAPRVRFFAIIVFSTSPLLFFEVAGRSDLIANLALLVLLIFLLERHPVNELKFGAWIFGLTLGFLGAARIALAPALFLIVYYMAAAFPRRMLKKTLTISTITFFILVAPFAFWNPSTFFHYAPLGVNSTKLGGDRLIALLLLVGTAILTLLVSFAVKSAVDLYAAVAMILGLVTLATWLTFSRDLSYLQMIFIPLLFAFPRIDPPDSSPIR